MSCCKEGCARDLYGQTGMCHSHYESQRRRKVKVNDPQKFAAQSKAKYQRGKARPIRVRRNEWLRWRYGITHDDYDRLLEQQNGLCAICDSATSTAQRSLAVDHDHDSGKVRGLLCDRCNRGIGFFDENPETILRAAAYLRRTK